ADLPVHPVSLPDVQHALVVRLDFRVELCHLDVSGRVSSSPAPNRRAIANAPGGVRKAGEGSRLVRCGPAPRDDARAAQAPRPGLRTMTLRGLRIAPDDHHADARYCTQGPIFAHYLQKWQL